MKKIFATTLAAVMTVSLTSVAFAATEEKGFVLGYKEGTTPGTGTTVYADQDDDGNYDETTLAPWRLALRSMFPFCCGMMTIPAVLPVPLKAVSWFSPQAMTSRDTRSMQTGRSAM